jgi:hypothetical protein
MEYRVERSEDDGLVLVHRSSGLSPPPLEFRAGFFSLSGKVAHVGRSWSYGSANEGEPETEKARIVLHYIEASIGAGEQEGYRSLLADDAFFVIEGSEIRHAHVADVVLESRQDVVSHLDDLELAGEMKGLKQEYIDHWKQSPQPVGVITGNSAESLGCVIGLLEPRLKELVESCIAGRVRKIGVSGTGGALSTAAFFEAPRDWILTPERPFLFRCGDLWVSYSV